MLEVRYIEATGEITGWCGDPKQFGNLDRHRPEEVVKVIKADIPVHDLEHYRDRSSSYVIIDLPAEDYHS